MRLAAATWPVSAAMSAEARIVPTGREVGGLSEETFDASGVLLRLLMMLDMLRMIVQRAGMGLSIAS